MKPADTDSYLAALAPEQRAVMQQLREAIHAAAPEAEEGFSYDIPSFTINGRAFIWYGAWAKHYSVYPVGTVAERELADDLAKYRASKGTLKFPSSEPLPWEFIARFVRIRATEKDERA